MDTALYNRGFPSVHRHGRPRPIHYFPRKPPQLLNAGLATTGWSAIGNATITAEATTNPEGVSQTLLKMQATAANTNTFWDLALTSANNSTRKGVIFDIFLSQPATSATSGRLNSGVILDLSWRDTAGTNSVVCQVDLSYGWNRVELTKEDFSIVNGTGNWDTTLFVVLRWKLTGATSYTPTVFIRNLCWNG